MTSTMAIDRAQRRVNEFRQRCGDYGETALHLAYHAALPVALNAGLLHLLRINFFLDPPEPLPYTAEFEFLLSPLCREIDEGLYEIEPDIRDVLLAGLTQTYDTERIRDLATLLWQYVEHHSPWGDRVELERAQQLTALNFLNSEKAQQWLATVEPDTSKGEVAEREWFVAMRQEIENQAQFYQDEKTLSDLLVALNDRNSDIRKKAAETLGKIGSEEAISALIGALQDENYTVRSTAVEALGDMRAEAAISALVNALQDANNNVRAKAVVALDKINPEAAISALLQATNDSDADVRGRATEVLMRVGHDQASDDLFNNILDRLTQQTSIALLRSPSDSKVWMLKGKVFRIGRGENNDLVIQKPEVSRQHAEISCRYLTNDAQPTYFLRDFSRYGSWILSPETEGWQRVHQQEIVLTTETQLKFGDIRSSALEFSITPIEILGHAESNAEEIEREPQRYVPLNIQPVQVFISYDRRDEVFYNQLTKYLNILRQERVIAAWHERCNLLTGKEQKHQVDPFLESADIILFLISADFLNSHWEMEVSRALERQDAGEAQVIPIILRPADWSDTSLSKLQVLPKNGKPITGWGNRDEAFLNVIEGIRGAAEQMVMRRSQLASSKLTSEQRRKLKRDLAKLQEQYDSLTRQLQHSQRDYANETNAANRLRFQKRIEEVDSQLEQLQVHLEQLEQHLSNVNEEN